MLPSRFRALNSDSSDDSDSKQQPNVTREALEQKAIAKYQAALAYEQKGEWSKTEKILRDLLKSDVLQQATGKLCPGQTQSSLIHLKYCIFINLGHCLAKQDKLDKALKYYLKASRVDNSDLNLWFKIGLVSMKVADLSLAFSAFEEGLRCSPNHWPCLDNLVSVAYALGDHISCLFYIAKGLSMDDGFLKGHVFKEKIFTSYPSLKEGFKLFHPDCEFPPTPLELKLDDEECSGLIEAAEGLRAAEEARFRPPEKTYTDLVRPKRRVRLDSWVNLAKCLLHLHDLASQEYPRTVAFCGVRFSPETPEGGEEGEMTEAVEIEDVGSEEEAVSDEKQLDPEQDDEEQGKGVLRPNGPLLERLASSQKRRSARVRSTVRREEPSLAEVLRRLIPYHLLPLDIKREGERLSSDDFDTMDLYKLFEMKDTSNNSKEKEDKFEKEREMYLSEEGYFSTELETAEVEQLIKEIEEVHTNIFDAMVAFLLKLSGKWKLHWPDLLGRYFVMINQIVLEYYPPTVILAELPRTFEEDLTILLYGELLLDEWLAKGKERGLLSPLGNTPLGGEFCSLELGRLNHRAVATQDLDFILRSYWLEALLFLHCGDTEACQRALQQILDDPRCETISLKIPNITYNSRISCKVVLALMKGLRRNKSLSQVMNLYKSKNYEDVAEILGDALTIEPDNTASGETLPRNLQYAIILDSYWKLGKFKECLYWVECGLYEMFIAYRAASEDEERAEQAKVIVQTLQGLQNLIEKQEISILKSIAAEKLSRLVQTLCSIINLQVSAPENSSEMPIETVKPWILLHYILKFNEEYGEKTDKVLKEDEEEELPSSLLILFQGHEYLGRRSWCCYDEGALLFHTLTVLYPLVQSLPAESQALSNLSLQVDQIFYCLYGFQKKNKVRNLSEHKVLGLALTWGRARQVFAFSRPRDLPSYDSPKCLVSADSEAVYLKLLKFIPDACNPNRLIPEMSKYIDGETDEIPQNDVPLPSEISDIFFLLAHYYYKAKCWSKVWQYHLLDLCVNPTRYASWAGIALSRAAELETRLNSCETIKNEVQFLSLAATVCRCYKKSLDLEPLQNTLWIERGTFSYTIHSFCSNVIKKGQNLSIEMYHTLEDRKEKMLEEAYQCFLQASKIWYDMGGTDIMDERWLHHYMFGKISKKKDEEPTVYINHYMKSAALLHEIGASYPALITYNSPQPLAVEALELFYRVHICILKTLEEAGDRELCKTTMDIFKQAVIVMAQSPFVTQVKEYVRGEKVKKVVQRRATDSSNEEYVVDEDEEEEEEEDEVELPISKDVEAMVARVLEAAELEEATNPLKRKLSVIVEENENLSTSLKEGTYGGEVKKVLREGETETPGEGVETAPSEIPNAPEEVRNAGELSGDKLTPAAPGTPAPPASTAAPGAAVASAPPVPGAALPPVESSSTSLSSSSGGSDSSSSSSSTSGSSSSSSSSSSASSASSSQSSGTNEPAAKKPKLAVESPDPDDSLSDSEWLIKKCLAALELCKTRFPEHYKSIYHLARFYFKNKKHKDNEKVKELLLGPKGLFADRRATNFFNGIWRIPNGEIDRPGSFAAHMGRCAILLLEYLRETKDHSTLFDLALHLKIVPDAEKKYVRDSEREELSREAGTLCLQILRNKLRALPSDELPKFLLNSYSLYKRATKMNLRDPKFSSLLCETYAKLSNQQTGDLDTAVRYCQQQIQASRQQQQAGTGVAAGGSGGGGGPGGGGTAPTGGGGLNQPLGTTASSGGQLPPVGLLPPPPPSSAVLASQPPGGLSVSVAASSQPPSAAPLSQPSTAPITIIPQQQQQPPSVPLPLQPPLSAPSLQPLSAPGISAARESPPAAPITQVGGGGSRRGSGGGRGTSSGSRKPRGRPPGSGSGPRLPRGGGSGLTFSSFINYQTEQLQAEFLRRLPGGSTAADISRLPAPSSQSVVLPAPATASGSSSVLKDRPCLSITPLKSTPPSGNSPINKAPIVPPSIPPRISTTAGRKKNVFYHPGKQTPLPPNVPQPPPPGSSSAWSTQFRASALTIQPLQSKPSSQEVSLQHKILSAKKIGTTNPPPQQAMPSLSTSTVPSSCISITPTIPKGQPSTSTNYSLPSPSVSITPTSVPGLSPRSLTPTSLGGGAPPQSRHAIEKSVIMKAPSTPSDLPFHPSKELTVVKQSLGGKTRPPLPSSPRKEIVSSISIIPTTKVDSGKTQTSRPSASVSSSVQDDVSKTSAKIPALESSVAETLRNFGSSITITSTNKKSASSSQDEMTITPVAQTKNKKPSGEVIVLDD